MFIKLTAVVGGHSNSVNTSNIIRMFPHSTTGTWVCFVGTSELDVLVEESVEQIMELINGHK